MLQAIARSDAEFLALLREGIFSVILPENPKPRRVDPVVDTDDAVDEDTEFADGELDLTQPPPLESVLTAA